jgi:uncharacterized protein YecE (DUF72 family)
METRIGCSGYYYNHWKGIFYPESLPKKDWLIFYSQHFNTVEINNTFYRMPGEKAVQNWFAITPAHFVFAVKGYRYFTHLKRLIADDDSRGYMNNFMKIVSVLKEKAGPLLWQLPGSFKADITRLEKFCLMLSNDFQHVFEFRHPSWFNDEVYGILEKYNHSLCIVSGPSSVPEIRTTAPLAYIRFHGEGTWYNDNYSDEKLQLWKVRLESLNPLTLFAYFNNDVNAFAVNNGKYFDNLFSF